MDFKDWFDSNYGKYYCDGFDVFDLRFKLSESINNLTNGEEDG